jgi:hypothetical protein
MPSLTLKDRVDAYNRTFPSYPKLATSNGWIVGTWIIGNYYRNKSDYYGCYPHSYLKRIGSMFPDCKKILHVFSGSVQQDDTFDINPQYNPTYVGDAHKLSEIVKQKYELIFADPPYSEEDAQHYGTPMINRNVVVKECAKVLENEGFMVWLDQVFPMYRKKELVLVGVIGVIRSTNHRVRTAFIFRKANQTNP